MCRFYSAIAVKDESVKDGFRLLSNPWTHSHSDLIALFKLRDNDRLTFARVEFYPDLDADLAKPDKYKLHIDEERTPEWFTTDMQDRAAERLRVVVKNMIVDGDVDLLCGGVYIVAGGAKIGSVKQAYIDSVSGSAKIGSVSGSAKIENDQRTNK